MPRQKENSEEQMAGKIYHVTDSPFDWGKMIEGLQEAWNTE
jgi:hypothetical protein